uniref:LIM zinc-binding domain-containing protein n=1 Tax=Panagrellus redivivus TaxID=6233 RepID=A0A7E4USV3_PANRE
MERPDQICFLCKLPISDAKWTLIKEKTYHNDCMECGSCKKRGGFEKFVIRENMAFCGDCDASALSKQASINTWNHDAQARQCSVCKSTAVGQRLLRAGKVYCGHCYRCYHCQQPMNSDNCLLLLDRLYCFGCENEYNAQKYMLAKWGSGPLVLSFL